MNAKQSPHVRPPIPTRPVLPKLCLLGLAAGIALSLAHAASYTEDFTWTPSGANIYGSADAPAIDVKYGRVTLASTRADFLETGEAFVDVVIKVDEEGYLDLTFNGMKVYEHLACYQPTPGRFALSARTGGLNDNHWFDDLSITTTVAAPTAPLKISRITVAGGNVTITWNGGPGVKLQKTATLTTPNWQDVPGSLGNTTVTEALSGAAAFYRASRP
jgi:hypothetical protein